MIFVCVRACYDVQYNIRRNESNACSEELNTFSSCSARPSCATPCRAATADLPDARFSPQHSQRRWEGAVPLGRDLIVGAIYQVRRQAHDLGRPVVRKPHMRLFGIVDWSIGSQKALIEVCESKMRRVSVPLGAPCTFISTVVVSYTCTIKCVATAPHRREHLSRRGPRTR